MPDPARDIPPEQRALVEQRDHGRCAVCYGPGTDWHHRRSRRVRADHRHCACVGVLLCRTCHNWVHAHPKEAMSLGFIVSTYEEEPWKVPVQTAFGWMVMTCDGRALWTTATERLDHLPQNCVKVTTTSSDGDGPSLRSSHD